MSQKDKTNDESTKETKETKETELMTANEVCELLRIDKWGLGRLKKRSCFPVELIISHKKRLWRRAEINNWLDNLS